LAPGLQKSQVQEADTGPISDDESTASSTHAIFNRYNCLICPSAIPIEAQLIKPAFLPDEQIEVKLVFNSAHMRVASIRISLWLQLVVKSLLTSTVIRTIDQELGAEHMNSERIRALLEQDSKLRATFNLLRTQHRNELLYKQL
jgi:hypothetical protein